MVNLQRTLTVARFEWLDALGSRLIVLLALLYAGGAAVGSAIFLSVLNGAEELAKDALSQQMNVPPSELPAELLREQAMPWLASWVEDPSTRAQLLSMDPLSIFFGWGSLQLVALFVFLPATKAIAGDVGTGATRFVLFRCDRLSYCVGKALAHAALLGAGLLLAASASFAVGSWMDGQLELSRAGWLLRTAFRAWLFGLPFLGIFLGVSMTVNTATSARLRGTLLWFALSIAHAVLGAQWFNERVPGAQHAGWLFPSHHQAALWSANLSTYMVAVGALLAIAVTSFALGYRSFTRRDA